MLCSAGGGVLVMTRRGLLRGRLAAVKKTVNTCELEDLKGDTMMEYFVSREEEVDERF